MKEMTQMVVYQIAEVSQPLTAASGTCDQGTWVVYTPHGAFIMNCQTGERASFDRKGGIYELDFWITDEDMLGGEHPSSFPRQGY